MIISEVNAVLGLVVKAGTFAAQVQDDWYKGSAELDAFQGKVWTLSAKHAHWSEQLQRYGIFDDKHLLRLVKAAEEALEKQEQSLLKLKKSPLRRWKKRVFPGQLTYFLDKVLEIVDAGPQLLASRVATNDLLERYFARTPAQLPFGPDRNYVPIASTILAVQNSLAKADGPRVVTLHGGPGMGKSSLVKYLAIHYEEEQKRLGMGACFPHGVYYLYCGQHAVDRVKELQLLLLESLGSGSGSAIPNDSTTTGTGTKEADYIALASNQLKLRSRLVAQEVLVILDDLWEPKVLHELLVPGKGVKYLVTSQMSDVYLSGERTQINPPTVTEATHILANYTDGLPTKGEFPSNIKSVAADIIQKLEYHPLSLANTGISIHRTWATDPKHWDVIRNHIYNHLDENDYSPPAYDRPYNLPVSASMMLMVESLPAEAQRLLFLIALLNGQNLPEPLVKYFYSFLQTDTTFLLKYNNHVRCLEGKSLIELRVRGNRSTVDTHGLRTHYVRDRKGPEVRAMGSQILATSRDQDVAKLFNRGDGEETLVAVLSAMYYHDSLKDVVAGNIGNHIPRSLNIEAEKLDLVKSARQGDYRISELVWLLNADADHEEQNWRRQAHEFAKKITIKYICQGKLEDSTLANLLQLPQTTSIACATLLTMYDCHREDFFQRNVTFSEAYGATMQTLLHLFYSNVICIERRAGVIHALLHVLDYESEETIRDFTRKYDKLFAAKSNSDLRDAVTKALGGALGSNIHGVGRGILMMVEFSGFLESLMVVFLSTGNNQNLRRRAIEILNQCCRFKRAALKIAVFPGVLQTLFEIFMSQGAVSNMWLHEEAGECLLLLSMVPEIRVELGAYKGLWDGLGGVLTKLEDTWLATHKNLDLRWPFERAARLAAGILGYLALEKDLRATIASLPGIREVLLFLQVLEMRMRPTKFSRDFWRDNEGVVAVEFYYSTRALTLLYSNEFADEGSPVTLLRDFEAKFPCDAGSPSHTRTSSVVYACGFAFYWTRVVAHIEMGSYAEGLENLDLADHHADLVRDQGACVLGQNSTIGIISTGRYAHSTILLRDCQIFLQTMLGDYTGALLGATRRLEECKELSKMEYLVEKGVLRRLSGDLQGALDEFENAASVEWYDDDSIHKADILWQRGYVKYLMEDKAGAKKDAESAQILKFTSYMFLCDLTELTAGEHLWQLRRIPVSYLGYSYMFPLGSFPREISQGKI